jgi:photosystem II stability/assembly factor-like uncharacterized protein
MERANHFTTKNGRAYYQQGGGWFDNKPLFTGVDTNYIAVTGLSRPLPDRAKVNAPDPFNTNRFVAIASTISAEDYVTASVAFPQKYGAIPRAMTDLRDPLTVYIYKGTCENLSDMTNGWRGGYITTLAQGYATNIDHGDQTQNWDGDDLLVDTLDVTFEGGRYAIGQLNFAKAGSSTAVAEYVDVAYWRGPACLPARQTAQYCYWLTKGGTATSTIQYTVDGGKTNAAAAITGIASSETPSDLVIVNDLLVVLVPNGASATASALYYARLNDAGVPGAFTKVTTGFVSTKLVRDGFVVGSDVFMVGDAGYIYKSSDITAGVTVQNAALATTENLLRIKGDSSTGDTLLATGANGTILKSTNRGDSWSVTSTSPVGAAVTVQAVGAIDAHRFVVGTSAGNVYSTADGGLTWTIRPFSGSGAGAVDDILVLSPEVMYIAHRSATPTANVLSTWNGGYSWATSSDYRFNGLTTFNKANRLAAPPTNDQTYRANMLAIAGLAGNGTDGVAWLAIPNIR